MSLEGKSVKSAKNLFFSCNNNVLYTTVINEYQNNFLQYLVQSRYERGLTNEEKVPFLQLSLYVPRYLLNIWIKIISKNSNNEYRDNLPYDVQSNRFITAAFKSFKEVNQQLFELTTDYLTGLFYEGKKLTNNELEYLLYTNIYETEKIFVKYGISIKLENWNE